MKLECRFCHEDLSELHPMANIYRHQIGLCTPSHNEVDACLLEIEEAEKQQASKAIEYAKAQWKTAHRRWELRFVLSLLGWFVFLPVAFAFLAWVLK